MGTHLKRLTEASNEYPQRKFLLRNKKDISIFLMKKAPYLLLCMNIVYKLSIVYYRLKRENQKRHIDTMVAERQKVSYGRVKIHSTFVLYSKCLKILYTNVSDKMVYANSADPDQTADQGLPCLPFY